MTKILEKSQVFILCCDPLNRGCYNSPVMIVEIPDQIVTQSGLSAKEILLKIAILLFQEEKLTLGQASKLAELHQFEFQKELAKRRIPVHYDEDDFRRDLQTLAQIK